MGDAFQSGAAELIEWRWHRLRFASDAANDGQRTPSQSCKKRMFQGASFCAHVSGARPAVALAGGAVAVVTATALMMERAQHAV
jgi:hypothetical protein